MTDHDADGCLCRDHKKKTLDRPLLFLPLIVLMFASFGFLLAIAGLPFGVQLGSLMPYTCLIVLGTFSAQRGQQPYFFKCAIVQSTMNGLVRRHILFVIALVLIKTFAIYATRYMPPSWLIAKGRGGSPVATSLFIFSLCLAFVQMLSNRLLIERAHREKNVVI